MRHSRETALSALNLGTAALTREVIKLRACGDAQARAHAYTLVQDAYEAVGVLVTNAANFLRNDAGEDADQG